LKLKLKLKLKLNSTPPPQSIKEVVPTHLERKSFNNYNQSKDTNITIYIETNATICIDNVPAFNIRFMSLTTNQIDNTKGEMKRRVKTPS